MKLHRTLQLLVGMTLATSAATASVIGGDDRRIPDAGDAGLRSAVGLVVCSRVFEHGRRRSAGTATVVGNRSTLLTAAHVFEDESGRLGPRVLFDPAEDCVFRQYDAHGDMRVEAAIRRAVMGEFRDNAGEPNQDWAILSIASPLPESSAPLAFADNTTQLHELNDLPIRIIAFHADLGRSGRSPMLSEGRLFPIDYGGFPRLAHTADTGRMSSGAAIVHATSNGENVVVGINRSSANFADFNLAVPFSVELTEALRSFTQGQVPVRRLRLANRHGDALAPESQAPAGGFFFANPPR